MAKKNPLLANEVQEIIQTILPKLEETLSVQDKHKIQIDIDTCCAIEKYLKQIDVYDIYPARYLLPLDPSEKEQRLYEKMNRNCRDVNLVCHPGLRYGQADVLRAFLEEEMVIRQISPEHQDVILSVYDDTVLGIMLEEVILHEFMLACRKISELSQENKNWDENMRMPVLAAKLKTLARKPDDSDKEIDIAVIDRRFEYVQYYFFEVKHTCCIDINQRKWILNKDFTERIHKNFGENIVARSIIYMGTETITEDGVIYINAENILKILHNDGLDNLLKCIADKDLSENNFKNKMSA